MKIIASLGRGLGNWLGLPSRETLGLSSITASASVPEVVWPSAPAPRIIAAPVASAAPNVSTGRHPASNPQAQAAFRAKREREENEKLIFGYQSKMLSAKTAEAKQQVMIEWAQFREARAGSAPRPIAKAAPALEDDNQTATDPENPAGIDSILSQLLDLLTELKKLVATTPADDDEAVAALGEMAKGRKLTASQGLMALTQKMCKRPKLSPTARTARGFSGDDSVKAIQACLRPRIAPAARTAPVAIAAPAVVSPSDRPAKILAIQAAMKSIDAEQRKQFSNARHSEHLKLKAQLHSLRLK